MRRKAYNLAWALCYVGVLFMVGVCALLVFMGAFAYVIWPLLGPPLTWFATAVHEVVNTFPFWGYANRPMP